MSSSLLDTLPVEILYRIFDHLDIQTILLSIRYVCKRFYLTTNSYNRYNFNFKSISRPHFHLISQLIPIENVISLTLSDVDKTCGQIQLFLSLFHIEQFIRLRSLTLLQIEEDYLNHFLNYIIISSLKSLAIETHILNSRANTTPTLLSSAVTHHTLQNLSLNLSPKELNGIQWSNSHTLHYLRIVNSITLKQFCLILQHSLSLQTLVLKEIKADDCDEDIYSTPFQQLISLTFQDGRIEIDKLEQCLSLTPCLTYLKLIGNGIIFNSSFDGLRWENLLKSNLRLLKKFEFFFCILIYSNYRSRNVELLITQFQTSFWLNKLNCYITCDFIINSRKLMLYTLPICNRHFVYHTDLKRISLSNFTIRINNTDKDNVQELELQLTKDINSQSIEKNDESNHFLFRNVTNLTLGNDGEWPRSSRKFLSTILDLSHIVKLSLSVNFIPKYMPNIVTHISTLLNQASNIRSLLLFDYWSPDNCMTRMETICSMISPNIKHLQIRVKNIDDIKYILERLEYLTSVTFEYAQILTINREEFIQCLTYLKRYSSLWNCQNALHVWLGNNK